MAEDGATTNDDYSPVEVEVPVNFEPADNSNNPAATTRPRGRDRSESVISEPDPDPLASEQAAAAELEAANTTAMRNVILRPAPFHKIVLTGGPCGGKTTALARLSSYLRERGFEVITCPEAYGILFLNGFEVTYFGTDGMGMVVQDTVMKLQESMEDGFEKVLRARGKPAVLLCDRGLMDGAAYMSSAEWDELLQRRGIKNVCELREGRYNAVFHLITAAEGADKFYTLENNEVRTETPEQARVVDAKTRAAWIGHPKLCVFDNSTNFEGKLQRLVDTAAQLVGLPAHLSRSTTKFLLKSRPNLDAFPEDVKYHIFSVEKAYLYDDNKLMQKPEDWKLSRSTSAIDSTIAEEYSFIRKRTSISTKNGRRLGSAYGQTTVQRTVNGQTIEVKRIISRREYNAAYKGRDRSRHVVKQTRISFLYNMQSFNIHIYDEPVSDLCILHAQAEVSTSDPSSPDKRAAGGGDVGAAGGAKVDLPPFLDVERRLTSSKEDEEQYGAFSISRIGE
mmetsp:Transcript_29975/g.65911  ORF Transcript_29975/g.65911 Transcript_29975/m.65911 type:complete len:507 (-) Transcript_29975:63-1583(-)